MSYELMRPEDRWAAAAKEFADAEDVATSSYLSTRGGSFSIGEDDLGRELVVVVLDAIRENVYYDKPYRADEPQTPKCFAFGRLLRDMAPEIEAMREYPGHFEPQAANCQSCPKNQWGSARQGRGKACGNRRRLLLIPAGFFHPPARRGAPSEPEIFTDPRHYANAGAVTLKLPVTSVGDWSKYVKWVRNEVHRTPYGVITRLSIEPDRDTQYRLCWEMLDLIPDEMQDIMFRRHDAALEQLAIPYRPFEDDDHQPVAQQRQPGSGLRFDDDMPV